MPSPPLYTKPPLTFGQQVELLKSRGLSFGDPEAAEEILEKINYYRLSAHWHPWKLPDNTFRLGASFDEAVQLYEFDRKLRLTTLDAIERVEIALRTQVAYILGHHFGALGYLDPTNLHGGFAHQKWTSHLALEVKKSSETFVEHHKKSYSNYPNLPIWIATELMSLGSLSKLINGMKPEQKRELSTHFAVPSKVLCSWTRALTYLRNLCAHHCRVWNRELSIVPMLPRKQPHWRQIGDHGNKRIWCMFLVLRHLSSPSVTHGTWIGSVSNLLNDASLGQRKGMGVPEDWGAHPLWNPAGAIARRKQAQGAR